jgi:hypothetical protein
MYAQTSFLVFKLFQCCNKNWIFALVAQTRIVILFVLIARAKLVIFYFVAQTRI